MKTKRVGTISMAIILIAMGVIMFISQINERSALDIAFKFWPLTLVLLGIEILWARYKSNDESNIIKYDIFSIFIVFIILMVNIGLYGITETGVMKIIKSKIFVESYNYELPNKEFIIDESVDSIIVEGFSNVKVNTTDGNKIFTMGSVSINSDSEESAKEIFNKDLFKIEQLGKTVYIKCKYGNDYRLTDLNINIPADIKVEIRDVNELDLVLDNLENNWIIDNVSRVKLRLNKGLDINVNTVLNGEDNLRGNVKWTATKIGKENNNDYEGKLVYGDGTNTLNIINSYEVIADEI